MITVYVRRYGRYTAEKFQLLDKCIRLIKPKFIHFDEEKKHKGKVYIPYTSIGYWEIT